MKAHFKYLSYVLRHKYFVFIEGLRLGVPIWQLIVHDLSKFSRAEWKPYVHWFNVKQEFQTWHEVAENIPAGKQREQLSPWSVREYVKEAFDEAWNHHQKANPHHWQYWMFRMDSGEEAVLPMPYKYVLEMLADWAGAGKALGKSDVKGWYESHKDVYLFHPITRAEVESLIEEYF